MFLVRQHFLSSLGLKKWVIYGPNGRPKSAIGMNGRSGKMSSTEKSISPFEKKYKRLRRGGNFGEIKPKIVQIG